MFLISTRELAALAGVSQSTISRSLNDHSGISPETKERIRALAKKHGYIVRNKSRKTLATNKRRAIGVLSIFQPFFNDLFINQLLSVLYSYIEQENYYAMPLLDFSEDNGIQKIKDLMRLDILEGLVIINRVHDQKIENFLNEINLPHVYLIYFGRNSSEQVNIVDTDNFLGGYLAAKHLIELGHKNIITLTSPWDEFYDRTAGYKAALRDNGITPNEDYILSGDCYYKVGYQLTKDNLHLFKEATAIYAQCDVVAVGAIHALQDSGIDIPNDVSVIGSDDLELCEMCRPKLTSIAQPFLDHARVTVEKLLSTVNNTQHQAQAKTFLEPRLVTRNSTGLCRKHTLPSIRN